VLGAEGAEGAERVADAEERGGVVADFEVRGALCDELGELVCACVGGKGGERTAAGSSSRSILMGWRDGVE
jgi:hypothetical protein